MLLLGRAKNWSVLNGWKMFGYKIPMLFPERVSSAILEFPRKESCVMYRSCVSDMSGRRSLCPRSLSGLLGANDGSGKWPLLSPYTVIFVTSEKHKTEILIRKKDEHEIKFT